MCTRYSNSAEGRREATSPLHSWGNRLRAARVQPWVFKSPHHFTTSFLLFGITKMSKFCMFAYKYTTRLCSHPLCQQENSLVPCLAWIITKLFMIRMWGCDLTAIFSFPFSVFNTFQKLKIPNLFSLSLFLFLMLISNGNIAKQSAQYLCFVHLLPSLKINWLYSTLFSIFLHLDIIALCSHPKVTVIT